MAEWTRSQPNGTVMLGVAPDGTFHQVTTDASGNVISQPRSFSSFAGGTKEIASAGTAERLVVSSTPCSAILLTAKVSNTDNVLIGHADPPYFNLQPGDVVVLPVADVYSVFLDSLVNGEGVEFLYF